MVRLFKHIGRYLVVWFLLLALSGLTIPIHHEHSIERSPDPRAIQHSNNTKSVGVKTVPSTYHEIHLIKLGSSDSFDSSRKADHRALLKTLLRPAFDHVEFSPVYHLSSIAILQTNGTGPPSSDKCVLFCSFLI